MYYCNQCQCEACQTAKMIHAPEVKARADAIRLIAKAGDKGLTSAQLDDLSRSFRTLDAAAREELLDSLVNEGAIMLHTFKPESGRGKSRNAYLAVSQ